MRIFAICLGIISLALGAFLIYEMSMMGFPDGRLTEYEKATKVWHQILGISNFVFSFYFLYLGFYQKEITKKLIIATIVLIIINLTILWGVDYYFKHYMRLDNGIGG